MIIYTDTLDQVTPEKLQGFFGGWPNPPAPRMHYALLKSSDEVVLAVDEDTGDVVGFITAITRTQLTPYVPLMEVLPAYQKHEIARSLAQRLLGKVGRLHAMDLMCDPER